MTATVNLGKTRITLGRRTGLLIKLLVIVAVVQLMLLIVTNVKLVQYWGRNWQTFWLVPVERDPYEQHRYHKPNLSHKRVDSDSPELIDFEYQFPSDVIKPNLFVWHATNTWELCSALVSLRRTKVLVNASTTSGSVKYLLRLHLIQNEMTRTTSQFILQLIKKWIKEGGEFHTKDKTQKHLSTKSEIDLYLKTSALDDVYRSIIILDPFAIPMKPLQHLFSDRSLPSVMFMAPKAKSRKSLEIVEEYRRKHPLKCFGKASTAISTAMVVADYSKLTIFRTKIAKIRKSYGPAPLSALEFFNHEFACNDEIGQLPKNIVFEDVKDRESTVFDNAELFVFNSKFKPWTRNYQSISNTLPRNAKTFVADWMKETDEVCNGHEWLFTDADENNLETMAIDTDEPELTVGKKTRRGGRPRTKKSRNKRA